MRKILLILSLSFYLGVLTFSDEPDDTKKNITFKFVKIEIKDILAFLAKLDKKVVVIDDKIKGKLSISAPEKVSLRGAYKILMAMLDARGLSVLRTDKFLKIIPKQESIYQPIDVYFGIKPEDVPDEDRMVTVLTVINKAEPATVLDSIRSLISPLGNSVINKNSKIIILTDVASNIRRLLKIMPYLDVPDSSKLEEEKEDAQVQMSTVVYIVKYLKAKEVAEILGKVFAGQETTTGKSKNKKKFKFIPIEPVNSIIATANPVIHSEIVKTLEMIDIRRKQVLIDVEVIEFAKEDNNALGIILNSLTAMPHAANSIANTANFGTSITDGFFKYSIIKTKGVNFDADLEMMASKELLKIISRPKLLTADNQKAIIKVGEEEPILKSQTDVDGGNTVSDYIYKDIGMSLEILPHINAQNDVDVEIKFKMTNILAEKDFGNVTAPRMGKREIEANVSIENGKTLIIGGLIKERKTDKIKGVPFFMDIPVLGWFFRKTEIGIEQSELVMFITPHVIKNSLDGDNLTEKEGHNLQKYAKKYKWSKSIQKDIKKEVGEIKE